MEPKDHEQRLSDLTASVDARLGKIERTLEELKRRGEASSGEKPALRETATLPRKRQTSFWGVALVAIGSILLANHFHWFHLHVPMIPTVLVIFGIILILDNR